ncbi:uncharacterized protein LOC127712265 isoform X2 [Mytilus californianus]|uniref:uncharacterized protein LOC127712265 isoform X2 n=1 Tax=Mytilus californianus TaxID=6549 RepID=UPI0022473443|nr:uncharacterized protein LOC127712265 isoform X2 [Mytilus californianus]
MNMIELKICIVVMIFSQGTFMVDIYVQEGDSVKLTCPMKIPIANLTWRGPPEYNIYASGTTESDIKNVQVIHVKSTNENILKILKFEADNVGLYQCISLNGGDDLFNVTMLRIPNVSIVDEFNPRDETLSLSCIASGGVPDNYTYEWEQRTDAYEHIRYLSSKPLLTIRNNSIQSNGVYVCRVFNAYGLRTRHKPDSQCAVYNLTISAVPHFVFNNTQELYIYQNRTTEIRVYFIAHPAANIILLMGNKPALEFNSSDIIISVHKTTVVDYYHDKAVIVNGYEIKLRICVRDTLDFSNITVVLQNDRGSNNYTIQLKMEKHTVQYKQNVGSKPLLASLLTLSIFGVFAAALGLKFACGKYMTQSCKDNSTVQSDGSMTENDYDASTPQRHNDVQATFVNDVYGDVNQIEVTTHISQLIPTQRTVFQNQSSTTDGVSRMEENRELKYIEVEFIQTSNQRRQVMYMDDRTPYADVDLTIKADPLPDTDSESDEDNIS